MKRSLVMLITVTTCLFVLGAAWQAGRYAALDAETRKLEEAQVGWLEENRKLEAGISVLASRERAAATAQALGLERVGPERRILITLPKRSSGDLNGF